MIVGKVSIIIPVYNEKDTLKEILKKVETADFAGLEKEIIFVDDKSTDGSSNMLKEIAERHKVIFHEKNMGKGAAIRTAAKEATGDYTVIQDADLEYNPEDYNLLLPLLINDEADVVYGSRFKNKENRKNFLLKSRLANEFLTFLTNLLYGTKLTDMETCYKAFKSEYFKNVDIKSERFNFEPEITAKLAKQKLRFKEVAVSYNGRDYAEGKKIGWKDGVSAIIALIKFRFTN